jgi:NDP-sugar pyrophosphorylase family protein
MHAGERVAAYEHTGGYFAEHSTPERYLESNYALLSGTKLRNPPGALAGRDPSATVDPSATIVEPVRICAGAVIGPGITVGPRVVVGPGARLTESAKDTVVWANASLPGGTVETFGNGRVAT